MSGFKLLIGGKLVEGDLSMDVINPATEEVLAVAPCASAEQLDAAIAAAKSAFKPWAGLSHAERRACLLKLADAVEATRDELARLITQEQGKPITEATQEVVNSVVCLRHFAEQQLPVTVLEDSDVRRVEQHHHPLGVVGCIIPWNYPLLIASYKLGPALITGNCVVIKPSPTTPLATLKLGELCAGIFPAGVINIITDQNNLGEQLSRHPDIAKISFTGSTETGKKVMASSASTLKRLTLELGGNDAAIVMADADPVAVAPAIFRGATVNAGQVCLAIKRVYAHESIYDTLCDELAKLASATVVDDGLKQGTQMGPLQNRMQFDKAKTYLADAHAHGTVVAGGEVMSGIGYFVQPTIVRDITDGTKLVDEEQFGPILPVIKYSDARDAVARANASIWGLTGSIWGKDRAAAHALAREMEAGTVWLNQHFDAPPHIPFGGAKQSAIGVEFSDEGLRELTQMQIINEAKAPASQALAAG